MADKEPSMENLGEICYEFFESDWHLSITTYMSGIATTITAVVGCMGNIYSIWAVQGVRISKALVTYLIALALWDTGVLVCSLCYYAVKGTLQLFDLKYWWLTYLTYLLHGPSMTAMTGSVWMVVIITIVRHGAISNPFKHRTEMGSSTLAPRLCIIVAVTAVLYCIPSYFELNVVPCLMPETEDSFHQWVQVIATEIRFNPKFQLIYRVLLYLICISIGPFLLIFILTIRMIFLLRRSVKLYLSLREGRKRISGTQPITMSRHEIIERRTTNMLLVLLGKFLLCYSLPIVLNVLEAIGGRETIVKNYFIVLADVSNFLVVLNSATNFVVYFLWKQNQTDRESQINMTTGLRVRAHIPSPRPTLDLTPILTKNESDILLRVWAEFKEKENFDRTGSELIIRMLLSKPHLAVHFGLSNEEEINRKQLEKVAKIQHSGRTVIRFLDKVVLLLSRNNQIEARKLIRNIAKTHFDLGINLTTDLFRQFKRFFVSKALDMGERSFVEAQTDRETQKAIVWNKFLSFIVAEMKMSYSNEARHQFVKRDFGLAAATRHMTV